MSEIQDDNSNLENVSPEDIKNAWQEDENSLPLPSESTDEAQIEEASEEGEEQQATQEEVPQKISVEPIILRKQNKKLKSHVKQLEGRLADLEKQSSHEHYAEPGVIVDPATGQPIDEESIRGQAIKAHYDLMAATEQKNRAQKQEEASTYQRRKHQEFLDNLESEGSEKYADFDIVFDDDILFTPWMRDSARFLPNPEDVLYLIAKNPKELKRISNLQPEEQAREMVKLSHSLLNKSTSPRRTVAPARTMSHIKNNPVKRSSHEINENSSVAEIRAHMKKKGWG